MIINLYVCFVIIMKLYFKFTINIVKIKFFIMSSDIIIKYFIEFIDFDIINDIFCIKTIIIFIAVVAEMSRI